MRNFDSPILIPCCNWLNVIETPDQLPVWLLPPKNYRTVTCSHTCTHTYACMCRFKDCWPAMAKGAQGLFIVYNTDAEEDNQKEIERWYKISLIEYCKQWKVVERQCSGPHTANSAPFRSSTIDHCICSAGTRYLLVQTSFQMLRVVLSDLQLMSTYSTQALVSKLLTHVSTIADVSKLGLCIDFKTK